MSWLELSVTVPAGQQASIEAAFEDLGALSITLQDADADTPDEQAIFEPGVGETPVWNDLVLQALFASDTDRNGLIAALIDLIPEFTPEQISFREVADQDWTRAWMDQFQPMRFGQRVWIFPWNIEPPADIADTAIVRLDPGLAFGTGTHPTTALCLQWLDANDIRGKTLIDYGCGSGVLAIAALKLGAARVIGVDNDAQALDASRSNADRNDVWGGMDLYLPQNFPIAPTDILIANILAGPLHELAPLFARCVRPGGWLALSGILAGQEDELLQRYADEFDQLEVAACDGWIRINGRRRQERSTA